MTMTLTPAQEKQWREIVLSAFPHEAVALITPDLRLIQVENVAQAPDKAFEVTPADYIKCQPIAVLHSHTYPLGTPQCRYDERTPSYADAMCQQRMNIPWGISSTEGENVSPLLWFPMSWDRPLLGRQFCWFNNDCGSLVRDYYWQTFGIDIRYHYVDWEKGIPANTYLDGIKQSPVTWQEVELKHVMEGDMIVMSILNPYDHAAIWQGGKLLQQLHRKVSAAYPFGAFRSHINKAFRYIP